MLISITASSRPIRLHEEAATLKQEGLLLLLNCYYYYQYEITITATIITPGPPIATISIVTYYYHSAAREAANLEREGHYY